MQRWFNENIEVQKPGPRSRPCKLRMFFLNLLTRFKKSATGSFPGAGLLFSFRLLNGAQ